MMEHILQALFFKGKVLVEYWGLGLVLLHSGTNAGNNNNNVVSRV